MLYHTDRYIDLITKYLFLHISIPVHFLAKAWVDNLFVMATDVLVHTSEIFASLFLECGSIPEISQLLHNEAKRLYDLRFRTQEMKKTGFLTETHLLLLLETPKQVLMQGYGDMEKLVGQMLQTLFIGELSHVTRLLFIYPRLLLDLSYRVNF